MANPTKADVAAALKALSQAKFAESVAQKAFDVDAIALDAAKAATKTAVDSLTNLIGQLDPATGASL